MTQALLEVVDLHFKYNDVKALDGISMKTHQSERVALVGPNGSGKSTLLYHLNGTLRPYSGKISLSGRPVNYGRKEINEWRRRVGLIFQNPDDQLFASTVEQDISFGPLNLGLPEQEVRVRVEEALLALNLNDLRNRATHQLSFGQKKRAALAGVLAMRPEIMLLDEPGAGLDYAGADEMNHILNQLHRAGASLLIATHDMDFVHSWADRVIVLYEGRVLAEGQPEKVLSDSSLLATACLKKPRLLETWEQLQSAGIIMKKTIAPRTYEEMSTILTAMSENNVPRLP